MSSRLRRSRLDMPRQHGLGASLRRWTIPAIGALTPVGLIIVNIAAFIVHHLAEFRLGISVLAFVSGLMLNGWLGLKIYRIAKLRFPNYGPLQDRNQEVMLVVGMALIAGISFVEALVCYNGLSNEANLPTPPPFTPGVVATPPPSLFQALFARLLERGDRGGDER